MHKILLATTNRTVNRVRKMATLTILCNIIILGPKFLLTVKMWINRRVNMI
jgi:hypothetical protein